MDIYEDLENYDDAEEFARLRGENKDLKLELVNLKNAIKILQEDYDKLCEEFTKLEKNYSSLLKTARNEIARKTQTITNFNIDKDNMYISFIQGNTKYMQKHKSYCRCTCFNNYIVNEQPKRSFETDKPKKLERNDSNNSNEKVKSARENNSKEEITPAKDCSSEKNIKDQNKTEGKDNTGDKSDRVIIENKNKPTVGNNSEVKVVEKALSIKDRRKSMPADSLSFINCNSDDDGLNNKGESKQYHSSKDKSDRKCNELNGSTKNKKTSKTPTLEEKYHNRHESSGISHRSTRWENDRYMRDKYEHSRPDRFGWRENHYPKLEKRTRVLVSPPHMRYDKYHSKKPKEYRHYERPQPYDFDQHRYYDENRTKHKLPEFEEPARKRPKYEQLKRHPLDDRVRYEVENKALTETFEQLESQYASCQSPDYEQMVAFTSNPLKEIKGTASSPLEDPRENSSRYILKLDDRGKKTLTSLIGKNVNIIPIKRASWNLPVVNIPPPLANKPQPDDAFIKDIYNDLDSNIEEKIFAQIGEILETTMHNANDQNNSNKMTNEPEQVKELKEAESSKTIQVSLDKYKIPKVNHNDNSKKADVDRIIKSKGEESPQLAKGKIIDQKEKDNIEIEKQNHKDCSLLPTETVSEKLIAGNDKLINHNLDHHITIKGIVEGDLELSDETCDNTDMRSMIEDKHKQVNNEKEKETVTKSSKSKKSEAKSKESKIDKTKSTLDSNNKKDSSKEKHSRRTSPISSSKSKSRKKSQKQKDVEIEKSCPNNVQLEKKDTRQKKDNEPKAKCSKFKELFDTDSSSLITPEDLGIIKKVSSDQFDPIFEDAQDATDIKEIAKVKQDLMEIDKQLEPKNSDSFENAIPCVHNAAEIRNIPLNLTPSNIEPVIASTSKDVEQTDKTKIPDLEISKSISNVTPRTSCFNSVSLSKEEATTSKVSKAAPVANISTSTAPLIDPVIVPSITVTIADNATTSKSAASKIAPKSDSFVNINPVKDTDVVKTVIISTGIQPKCIETTVNEVNELLENTEKLDNPGDKFKNLVLTALATSTPQKDSAIIESKDSFLSDINKFSIGMESNNSASMSQSEKEVPDVRIFVQRRRRPRPKPNP